MFTTRRRTNPEATTRRGPPGGRTRRGKHFYYNNWDFNTLGTIYSQTVGEDLFKSFARRVATPVGMEDFTLADTEYHSERSSDHPAYLFKMSARDLARFGLLYLRGGQWRDAQVVPEEWVAASTATQVSAATENRSYGYMWWTYPQYGPYFGAAGSGGQNLVVDPTRGLVIVHQAKENWFGSGGVGPGVLASLWNDCECGAPAVGVPPESANCEPGLR